MQADAIVIGASAGGLRAIGLILSSLPASFPLPILVAQHIHPDMNSLSVTLMQEKCQIQVQEGIDKEPINAGVAYLAPPNYHLLVECDRTLSLSVDERVNFARPSIDVLFESASEVFESRLIGIVLTGANKDGAEGLKFIKANGGTAIVQDPNTAEYDAMPKAALEATSVDFVLPLEKIAPALLTVVGQRRQA
ncbi:MAG: chemotaxis protein CheB [Deltaproteobacteria bacterium]|nr:chemotaxis protein CheB [Deltaproteobacteria bacterium]MBI3294264.1 chemotaxis protein CheB [Deltaproteobacteria bacterium]